LHERVSVGLKKITFFAEGGKEIKKGENRILKIKNIMRVQYIIEVIEERRLKWFGYLKRMI
jgi:hypothetical protein